MQTSLSLRGFLWYNIIVITLFCRAWLYYIKNTEEIQEEILFFKLFFCHRHLSVTIVRYNKP